MSELTVLKNAARAGFFKGCDSVDELSERLENLLGDRPAFKGLVWDNQICITTKKGTIVGLYLSYPPPHYLAIGGGLYDV